MKTPDKLHRKNLMNSKTAFLLLAFAVGATLAGCGMEVDAPSEGPAVASAESALGGACAHDKCTEGAALDAGCSPAVASICAADPYCCNVFWDSLCVGEVQSVTNSLVCSASQGTCGHTLCTTGEPLVATCDAPPAEASCVTSICAVDPYCCNVQWDAICVNEVASVCGESCDASSCDLDGDGDATPGCGGSDCDDHDPRRYRGVGCGCDTGDLVPTECADDVIGYTNDIIAAINAITVPLAARTPADVLSCPTDTGVGEESHVNVFSYVGPLDKSCNRLVLDDCSDPARFRYWISVVDDRRAGTDPYKFQMIWGDEDPAAGTDVPLDYIYYGSCAPDPDGFDNAAAGIPRLLQPVNDVDGNGSVDLCPYQNHVFTFQFYTVDGNGERAYVEKSNIAWISSPFLADASLTLPDVDSADYQELGYSDYVAVHIELKQPAGAVVTAYMTTNHDSAAVPTWVKWKETCDAPPMLP